MKRRNLIFSLLAITAIALGGVVATLVTDTKPQLGLDLQGGASVTLQPVGSADEDSLNVVVDILRNRIDSLGVAEPEGWFDVAIASGAGGRYPSEPCGRFVL